MNESWRHKALIQYNRIVKNKEAVNRSSDYTNRFKQCITSCGIVAVTDVGDDFLIDKSGFCVKWPNVHLVLFQCN